MVCTMSSASSSGGCEGLDCDASSMLSTLSSFRCAFGRGVASEGVLELGSSTRSGARGGVSTAFGRCVGASTKRFAGVIFLNCVPEVWLGVCAGIAWRKFVLGFGLGVCEDDGLGAMKRCGEGFCVGIVIVTLNWSWSLSWSAVCGADTVKGVMA